MHLISGTCISRRTDRHCGTEQTVSPLTGRACPWTGQTGLHPVGLQTRATPLSCRVWRSSALYEVLKKGGGEDQGRRGRGRDGYQCARMSTDASEETRVSHAGYPGGRGRTAPSRRKKRRLVMALRRLWARAVTVPAARTRSTPRTRVRIPPSRSRRAKPPSITVMRRCISRSYAMVWLRRAARCVSKRYQESQICLACIDGERQVSRSGHGWQARWLAV